MADQLPTTQPQTSVSQASVAQPSAADQDEKFFAALGYFGPLFVLPLLVKPKSAFCKFHAQQSMVLLLVTIFVFMVLFAIPWFGSLLTLIIFAIYVLAIYKAYSGEMWKIPLISKYADRVNVQTLYGKAGVAMSSIGGLKETVQNAVGKAGDAVKSLGNQEEKKDENQPGKE